jgi:hypothetical protein
MCFRLFMRRKLKAAALHRFGGGMVAKDENWLDNAYFVHI